MMMHGGTFHGCTSLDALGRLRYVMLLRVWSRSDGRHQGGKDSGTV